MKTALMDVDATGMLRLKANRIVEVVITISVVMSHERTNNKLADSSYVMIRLPQ